MADIAEWFVCILILLIALGIGQYHAMWGLLLGLFFFGLLVVLGIKDFLMVIGFGILAIMCLVLVCGIFYDIFSGFFGEKRDENNKK